MTEDTSHPLHALPKGRSAPPEQLDMPLRKNRLEFFYSLKRRLTTASVILEALPYWKNVIMVLAFMSSILFIALITTLIVTQYQHLPSQIPVFYLQSQKRWDLTDKELLLPIPFILGIMLILINRLSVSVFRFDRRLAYMMNIAVILFTFLGTIAFVQLLSLVLVY